MGQGMMREVNDGKKNEWTEGLTNERTDRN
jgi:hypothetical protein